jgi:hypothetical protein
LVLPTSIYLNTWGLDCFTGQLNLEWPRGRVSFPGRKGGTGIRNTFVSATSGWTLAVAVTLWLLLRQEPMRPDGKGTQLGSLKGIIWIPTPISATRKPHTLLYECNAPPSPDNTEKTSPGPATGEALFAPSKRWGPAARSAGTGI